MNRPLPAHFVIAAILLVGVGMDVVAPASQAAGPSHKQFVSCVNIPGDSCGSSATISIGDVTLDFTITNTSTGPQAVPYGSFQLRAPVGFAITGVPDVTAPSGLDYNPPVWNSASVTFTTNGPTGSGVGPKGAVTIEVTGHVDAGLCPNAWGVQVKQSNDFSSQTGNDFVGNSVSTPVSGADKLVFTTPGTPSDTNPWTLPTMTQYKPGMTPSPVVHVEDACGTPLPVAGIVVTLSDLADDGAPHLGQVPTATTDSTGAAVFSAKVSTASVFFSDYGFDDVLTAHDSLSAYQTGSSPTVTVVQALATCLPDQDCPTLKNLPNPGNSLNQLVSIGALSAGTTDFLSASVKGDPATLLNSLSDPTCGQPAGATNEPPIGTVTTLNVTNRLKNVTVEYPKAYYNTFPQNGTPFADICLLSPTSFATKFPPGTAAYDSTAKVYFGVIPDCVLSTDPGPCMVKRYKQAGNEYLSFNLPAGDPRVLGL